MKSSTRSATCLSFKTVLLIYKKSFTQREFAQQMLSKDMQPIQLCATKEEKPHDSCNNCSEGCCPVILTQVHLFNKGHKQEKLQSSLRLFLQPWKDWKEESARQWRVRSCPRWHIQYVASQSLFACDRLVHKATRCLVSHCSYCTVWEQGKRAKEHFTLAHIKYWYYIEIFMGCLMILVLICWLILYVHYHHKTLVVVCGSDITAGDC